MKIVVTSHGNLCEGILSSYQMIAGDSASFIAVKLDESGIGDFSARLTQTLDQLLTEQNEVIVLSDIVGGTPYNETLRYALAHPDRVFLIAGLNLPMLIQAGTALEEAGDIQAAVQSIVEVAQSAVTLAKTAINSDDSLDF